MARRRHPRRRRPWYRTRAYRLTRTVVLTVALVVGGVWWSKDPQAGAPGAATAANGAPAGPATEAGPRTTDARPSSPRVTHAHPSPVRPPGARPSQPGPADARSSPSKPTGAHPSSSGPTRARPSSPRPRARPARPAPLRPLPRSRPTRIVIPYIGVDADVIGLGLDRDRRLTTPPENHADQVGWYRGGPSPGEQGTTVLVGHLDTDTGPAVFAGLNELDPGHLVGIRRADGRTAVYVVDAVRTYQKAHFPNEEVYGARRRPELRLITCGGAFDRRTGYAGNTVVFAHLTKARAPRAGH
ncbi:class F sortase [Streptomyces sp. NPDC092369]|uniref:class F sortase n=1 Tax=Streptomyces sp. NPDC092369 TaxID=3366015 RepID=UPI0038108076